MPNDRAGLTLTVDGQVHHIRYRLRRSARARRINLRIGLDGLIVTVPQRARLGPHDIERTIHVHGAWIIEKLPVWQRKAEERHERRPRLEDGGWVPCLGEQLTLRLQPHTAHQRGRILHLGDELWISGPASRHPEQLQQTLEAWLKKQAREVFGQRMRPLVEKLGRGPRAWGLSSARTRWGSCSRQGDIRLNWRLIQFSPELIDYVIAHELAHLIELNHGPRFWARLEALLPGSRALQKQLAKQPDVLVSD
ncbi:MAG: SprT family zinc-dependent metalloprotease [Lautropia sp.]|nr:SprT family zinc-dependent metalloprotease [Lautropia sp.]